MGLVAQATKWSREQENAPLIGDDLWRKFEKWSEDELEWTEVEEELAGDTVEGAFAAWLVLTPDGREALGRLKSYPAPKTLWEDAPGPWTREEWK